MNRKNLVDQRRAKSEETVQVVEATDDEIAYLAKRHRISPAIVREVVKRIGSAERSAVEREIKRGMMRR
jgi:DNA-binding MarR family transcriptional regulator